MCKEMSPWEKAVDFHGHACPGLAVGYKASEAAMQRLGNIRDVDEEVVAVVENDSCAVDALQSVLSCTVGKGNLLLRNNGKHVFTIGRRSDGRAVRMALKGEVMAGGPDGETKDEKMHRILSMPVEELFVIRELEMDLPRKAVIFKSVVCDRCGEGVMEPKARLAEGKVVCPDCFEEYTRGW